MVDVNVTRHARYFSWSYVLTTTALSMIWLPLFWQVNQGVSLERYLVAFSILPVISILADLPLSVLADKLDIKRVYLGGLILFGWAFILPLFVNGEEGLWSYILAIALADSMMSGLDLSLMRKFYQDKSSQTYAKLSRSLYLYAIPLFFLGIYLYQINPGLAMCTQGGLLFVASYLFAQVAIPKKEKEKSIKKGVFDFKVGSLFILVVLVVLLFSSAISGSLQLQNRVLQLLLADQLGMGQGLYFSAILFTLGNLVTSLGLSQVLVKHLLKRSVRYQAIVLCLGFCLGLGLIASGQVFGMTIGYLVLSSLKSLSRVLMNDLLFKFQPSKRWQASWYSVMGTVTALYLILANLVIVKGVGQSISLVEYRWLCFVLLSGVCLMVCLYKIPHIRIELVGGMDRSKRHFREISLGKAQADVFVQRYFFGAEERIPQIVKGQSCSSLPTPKVLSYDDKEIRYQWLDETISIPKVNLALLQQLSGRANLLETELSEVINGAANQSCQDSCTCLVHGHGDLHPENVLWNGGGTYYVIDWDFSGVNSRLWDELSYLGHPYLKLTVQERLDHLGVLRQAHDSACPLQKATLALVLSDFLRVKLRDIASWGQESKGLYEQFTVLLKEVEAHEHHVSTNDSLPNDM